MVAAPCKDAAIDEEHGNEAAAAASAAIEAAVKDKKLFLLIDLIFYK